ncbi:MAG TPA: nuclear transport factor 2 family protein [Reyranella sp.]|nr:nuclear transport factor 2 family protein [Reyranella sp.]
MTISRRQIGAVACLALGAATAPALAQANDQAAVAEAIAALTKAMLAADKAKLESLLSDNLSYGHSSGKIETKKEVVDVVAGKKTVYNKIELSNHVIAIAGNNAIARHAWESESGTGDGKWNVAKIGVLQVWAKEGGSWKLLARQAFKV